MANSDLNKKLKMLQEEYRYLTVEQKEMQMAQAELAKVLRQSKQTLKRIDESGKKIKEIKSQIKFISKDTKEILDRIKIKYKETDDFNELQKKIEMQEHIYYQVIDELLNCNEDKDIDIICKIEDLQDIICEYEARIQCIYLKIHKLKEKIAELDCRTDEKQNSAENKDLIFILPPF